MTGNIGDKRTIVGGDGRKFVTFLAYAAVSIAAASVFWLTEAYISPSDRLSFAVPDNAVLYVHGGYGTFPVSVPPPDSLSGVGHVPEGVRPYDLAVFAVPEGDSLLWGSAIGWRKFTGPSDEEVRLLKEAGWGRISRNVYAIGRASRFERPDTVPLLKTHGWALRTVANILPGQAYIAPGGIPQEVLPQPLSFLKELEPMVFGFDLSTSPAFGIALPVADASSMPAVLGFGTRHAPQHGKERSAVIENADLTVASGSAVIDPLNVLFWPVEEARLKRQEPPAEEYLRSADRLRTLLSGPIILSVLMDESGRVNYVARFPDSTPETIKTAVLEYLSSSLPERTRVTLPDRSVTTELRIDPEKFRFEPLENAELSGAEVVRDNEHDFTLVVAMDAKGGTYVSTDAAYIRTAMTSDSGYGRGRCKEPKGASILNVRVPTYGYSQLHLISSIDKLIIACGYRK